MDRGKGRIAFWVTLVPGLLVGIFGLGHIYICSAKRGYALLAFSVVLWSLLLVYFLGPWSLPTYVGLGIAVMWFVGWLFAVYDIQKVAKRAEAVPES